MNDYTLKGFVDSLSSSSPIPGGGGAAALAGSLACALCSMVSGLTTGKQRYAEYQGEIDEIINKVSVLTETLYSFVQKDAEVFEPLSKAYGIPKDDPKRDEILQSALKTACTVPYEVVNASYEVISVLERLVVVGSRLAISDVGVAASFCRTALESGALNVFINTKLIKDEQYTEEINKSINAVLSDGIPRCDSVYNEVRQILIGEK